MITDKRTHHNPMIPIKLTSAALALILTATACTTSLATIKNNPDRYTGEPVNIQGNLELKLPIPFTSIGVYILDDSTASMVIIGPADYQTGQNINTRAQVIGISKTDAVRTAKNSVAQIAEALVSREIAEPAQARRVASVVVKAVSEISGPIAGSYLLIDSRL
ncbi:MAG: hypothetical protein ACOC2R_05180 [Spirochaetota bacterium]